MFGTSSPANNHSQSSVSKLGIKPTEHSWTQSWTLSFYSDLLHLSDRTHVLRQLVVFIKLPSNEIPLLTKWLKNPSHRSCFPCVLSWTHFCSDKKVVVCPATMSSWDSATIIYVSISWWRVPHSALSPISHSHAPSHKLSVWPPFCTKVTGGIHNNLSLIPDNDHDQTWSDQLSSTITSFKGLQHAEPPVFTLLLCFSLWFKHGRHALGFKCQILFVTLQLTEAAQRAGSLRPTMGLSPGTDTLSHTRTVSHQDAKIQGLIISSYITVMATPWRQH